MLTWLSLNLVPLSYVLMGGSIVGLLALRRRSTVPVVKAVLINALFISVLMALLVPVWLNPVLFGD